MLVWLMVAWAGQLVHERVLHFPETLEPVPVGEPATFSKHVSFRGDGAGPDVSVASEFGPLGLTCELRGRDVVVWVSWNGGTFPNRLPETFECEVGKNTVRLAMVPLPPLYTQADLAVDPHEKPIQYRRYWDDSLKSVPRRAFLLPASESWRPTTVVDGRDLSAERPLVCHVAKVGQASVLVVWASASLADGDHACELAGPGVASRTVPIRVISTPYPRPSGR